MEVDTSHVPTEMPGEGDAGGVGAAVLLTKEDFQIEVGTELCQAPEILFEPSIVGLDCCGISELLNHTLSRFPAEKRMKMAGNIVVSGGTSQMQGILQRIEREARGILPFNTEIVVKHSADSADAWRGASRMAGADASSSAVIWMTRKEYDEMGVGYFKEHRCSNRYAATPSTQEAILGSGKK